MSSLDVQSRELDAGDTPGGEDFGRLDDLPDVRLFSRQKSWASQKTEYCCVTRPVQHVDLPR